jgi:hypothetical protein
MLRNALLIGAGIVAALVVACAPPPPPPLLGTASAAKAAATVTGICIAGQPNSADQFAAAVQVLQQNYDPQSNHYSPPENNIQQGYQLRKQITDDLSSAFSNAPLIVQNSLCGLTGVYINSTGCPNGDVNNCNPFGGSLFTGNSSWGFRGPGPNKGSTYIAISGGLWYLGGNYNAEAFADYENSILKAYAPWIGGPTISSSTPNYPWMTVLAALAHELGHVRRAQVAIPNGHGSAYHFGALTHCSIGNGSTIDFYSGWDYGNNDRNLQPLNHWRNFGNNLNGNNNTTDHSHAPYLVDDLNTNQEIDQLYQSTQPSSFNPNPYDQPWASLFSAQNPDDDFAETYVLYALMGKKLDDPSFMGDYLKNLPVTILLGFAVDTRDVPKDLLSMYKPTLKQKIQCIENLP